MYLAFPFCNRKTTKDCESAMQNANKLFQEKQFEQRHHRVHVSRIKDEHPTYLDSLNKYSTQPESKAEDISGSKSYLDTLSLGAKTSSWVDYKTKVDHVTHEGHSTDDELKAFDEKAQEYEARWGGKEGCQLICVSGSNATMGREIETQNTKKRIFAQALCTKRQIERRWKRTRTTENKPQFEQQNLNSRDCSNGVSLLKWREVQKGYAALRRTHQGWRTVRHRENISQWKQLRRPCLTSGIVESINVMTEQLHYWPYSS